MTTAQRILGRRGVRQFIKFGIVGATGMVVSFVAYHILLHYQLDVNLAFSIGFILGGVNNYWWNRHWTFRSKGHPWKELAQFIAVSAVALVLGNIITWQLRIHLPMFHLRNSFIWLCATVGGVGVNFFANKYWTFRHTHHAGADLR
jgi:putative flippase GtrA